LAVDVVGIVTGQGTAGNEADAVDEVKKEILKVDHERAKALQSPLEL
jgi:hypothetical protein